MAGKKRSAKIAGDANNLEQQIRCRAYELYEARGRGHGYDLDDWLRAERELRKGRERAVAA